MLSNKSDEDILELRALLGQKQRISLQLINILRNLDDKIMFMTSKNTP